MKNNIHGALKFLGSINIGSVSKDVIPVPAGRYSGFLVVATGTNDTDDDYTFPDNARNAIFRLNNDDLVNLPLGFLADFANLEYGTPGNSSTTSGAFSQAAIIPLQAKGHKNAIQVRTTDVASLTLDFYSIGDIASGTAEVYAIESDSPTVYLPRFYDISVAIASGQVREALSSANLIEVYGKPASTNLSNIRMEVDNITEYDASYTAAKIMCNIENNVETALTYFNAVLAKESLEEGLGAKVNIILQGAGADTVYIYVFAFDSDQNRFQDSLAAVKSRLQKKANNSQLAGNRETVSVVKSAVSTKGIRLVSA